LDSAYVSALFGLVGAIIGGLTSFSTTWLTQRDQLRDKHLESARAKREQLFNDFITEATRRFADALTHQADDITSMVQLYALAARMRMVASRKVVDAAENIMAAIEERYRAPNLTLREFRQLSERGELNVFLEFSEACRHELATIPGPVR
jgi:hypothetical protein